MIGARVLDTTKIDVCVSGARADKIYGCCPRSINHLISYH